MTIKMTSAVLAAAMLSGGAASADVLNYRADVAPLNFRPGVNPEQTAGNGFDVNGTVLFAFDTISRMLSVDVDISGLLPDVAHAQHIHGPDGDAVPPTLAQDADGDSYIELLEGATVYGPILLSLGSGIDEGGNVIFPVADSNGILDFTMDYDLGTDDNPFLSGDFTIADVMPEMLGLREYVIHGAFVPEGANLLATEGQPDGVVGGYNAFLPVGSDDITAVTTVAAVPVPAAAWMMVAALGALGATRMRRT